MKRWQFWLGMLISVALMWWALSKLNLADAWTAMQTANYWWLLPGITVFFIDVWVRAWRWHYLLKPLKPISTRTMFPIVTIGYMGNNIYPARAGELLRAYVLRRKEGVPVSASLATVIVERIFDGVVMLMFVFFNINDLVRLSGDAGVIAGLSIQTVTVGGTAVFGAALLVFLLAAMFPHQSLGLYHRFGAPLLPGGVRAKISGMVESFLTGLESLRSPVNIFMVFVTSVVIWLLETGKYWFVMHAFNFSVSFFALMLMNGIVNLATTLPAAPGYVGTFDAPGIAVLTAYGVPAAIAASYTLVLHVALWVPITLVGAYFMTREGLSWSTVQAEYKEIEKDEGASPKSQDQNPKAQEPSPKPQDSNPEAQAPSPESEI